MKFLFFLLFFFNPHPTTAKIAALVPQVGKHYPILTVEKNVNPENTMIVYTKTDDQCRFLKTGPSILFDFYWLMEHKDYKPVHKLIKKEIRKSLQIDDAVAKNATQFVVKLKNLEKVKTDIADPRLTVLAQSKDGECQVEGQIRLGPSDHQALIRLDSLYTEGRKFPPAVFSVTLKGEDVRTGKAITRKYLAK